MFSTLVTILVVLLVVGFFLYILKLLLGLFNIPSNIQVIILLIIAFACVVYAIDYFGLVPGLRRG
jgi:hypothetical protein